MFTIYETKHVLSRKITAKMKRLKPQDKNLF